MRSTIKALQSDVAAVHNEGTMPHLVMHSDLSAWTILQYKEISNDQSHDEELMKKLIGYMKSGS